LTDGAINMAQSNAILRHLARKFNLYGLSEAEKVQVDMMLDGVAALRTPYLKLVYQDSMVR
jgi:glutathione S-transferase